MENISFITEGLILILGITLVFLAFKYPKDVFIKIPLGIVKGLLWPLYYFAFPFILILELIGELLNISFLKNLSKRIKYDNDEEYKTDSKLRINFLDYEKYILTTNTNLDQIDLKLKAGISFLNQPLSYTINKANRVTYIKLITNDIFGFWLLVQHLDNELKSNKVVGFASNQDMYFLGWQDPKTTNNIIGITSNKEKFHYSMYEVNDYLNLFSRLKISLNKIPPTFQRWIKLRTEPNSSYTL